MLTNNEILKKLRVALQLKDDDILDILELVDFKITKGALGDLFRAEDHASYVEAGDQIVRNFLNGLVIYNRGAMDKKPKSVGKYQPNIIPKMEQKKDKPAYKPFTPKDNKLDNRGGSRSSDSRNKYGSSAPSKDARNRPRIDSDTRSSKEIKPTRELNSNRVDKPIRDIKPTPIKSEGPTSKLAKSIFNKDHFSK